MPQRLSRRSFALASVATVAAPAFIRPARADEPRRLRLSLDTAPSHLRNVSMKDYLGKVEAASDGKIKTEIFESGQLYPDLEVGKALIQGQVEMAAPTAPTWWRPRSRRAPRCRSMASSSPIRRPSKAPTSASG